MELCGGEASEVLIAGEMPDHSRSYRLDTDRVRSLVGMQIDADAQRKTLIDLGFTLAGDMAQVPRGAQMYWEKPILWKRSRGLHH